MKRILPLIKAAALLLTGCSGAEVPASGGGHTQPEAPAGPPMPEPAQSAFTLSAPVYPAFPRFPELRAEGGWDAYYAAEQNYYQAVAGLRADCDPKLVRGCPVLLNFAASSAPLALAGQKNAVYSPLSLWSALAMEAQCAAGDSRRQVLNALGVSDMEALRSLVRQLWLCLYTEDGRDSLILGNSIWLNSALEGACVQAALDALAQHYFAGVYSVPMGTEEADRALTEWIFQQTGGLIGQNGPVVETEESTLALLASSLYYRAGWEHPFFAENTREDTFTDADGNDSSADFMHKTCDGVFLLGRGYRAASLPTRLGEMVFVLPDEGVLPESLLSSPEFLNGLNFTDPRHEAGAGGRPDTDPAAHWGEVQWSVPKFDLSSKLDLMDAIGKLGITDLPDPDRADLSNLTDIPAYLSKALQLARVKVDEEGVEAAAVTVLMARAMCAPYPEDPEVCVMDLDRPFLFVVRSWGLPLFVGVVNQVG